MAKRVFNVAKELGVTSKAIVEKCRAEGIPEDVIKNHMSSVSAGLEATIHSWFGDAQVGDTAVETAEKVNLEKARAKPRRAKAKTASKTEEAEETSSDSGTATAVAEPAPEPAPTPKATPIAKPAAPETASEPGAPAAPAPDDDGRETEDDGGESLRPAASAPEAPTAPSDPASPGAPTPTDAPKTASPTMNVPDRPKVIAPAGPQLAEREREKVKLSGPKVVRVEAPEPVDTRPPRRGPPRGPGGGPGGPPMMPGDADSRSPRRGNKRRGPAAPGGAGVPARRRGKAEGPETGGRGAWSAADLAEREARIARSGGYMKQRRQQLKRQQQQSQVERPASLAETGGKVTIQAPMTIKDLSAATGVKGADIVKKLFLQGVMANINSGIDSEQAQEVMIEYDIELEVVESKTAEEAVSEEFEKREMVDERPRGPVVTILGHVDHGKTSLLDRIRNANVAAGEAGGITQATSAFRVPVKVGDKESQVVFIDTPGHQAFTEMRSRGATVTDICVIVVAADDGVMPQTIESIAHAKAAGTPIVIALNKIDKAEATDSNIQRILGQLAEHDVNPTEWGGEVEVVRTSATTGEGIDTLLEILDLQAELMELKADFAGAARGTVVESRTQEGRGAVASMLIQDGQLRVGDFIVAGRAFGRVRDITNDRGERIKEALPPMPVQISGLDAVPDAGDKFFCVNTLKKAQEAAEQRRDRDRETQLAQPKVTLDSLFSQMAESDLKEILIVIKADVQGSVDVLKNEIEKVSGDEVKVRVLHSAVGGIKESDVSLAEASRAIIIGFNVIPSAKARTTAESKNVEIRTYDVIYNITDDIKLAAEGLLDPELRQEVLGHAEVREVFKVSKVGMIAGCYVTDGVVQRDALIRVTRDDIVIENDRKLSQLKRFKDDAKEVRSGMECGMKIDGYDDIKAGDILECYKNIEVKRTL